MSGTRIFRLDQLDQFAAVNLQMDAGYVGGPVVIPNTAQIRIRWATGSGNGGNNILYGRYSGTYAGSQAQANAILTALSTGANWAALAAFLAPTAAINSVFIKDVNTRDQGEIGSIATGAAGTSTGTELPNEIAKVVTLRAAGSGKQNTGRMYIPGWATNALGSSNQMAAPAVTALNNWASTVAGALSAQGYIFSIGHRERAAYTGQTGTQHPARPAGAVPITNVSVKDNHWDSQRRRGLK